MKKIYLTILIFFHSLGWASNVIICGVCKNVETTLQKAIINIEELGASFSDYAVIIYENNSTDDTKTILQTWTSYNPKIILISEDLNKQQLSDAVVSYEWTGAPFRTELIAKARNRVLEVVRDPRFDHFDFVIMADLDFSSPWPIKEIVDTIHAGGDWDCVSSNGVNSGGFYYDRFALRNSNFPLGPELLGDIWWDEMGIKFTGDDLIPVYSAFGGLAIYKRDSILPYSYCGHVTEELASHSKTLLVNLPRNHSQVASYLKLINAESLPIDEVPIINLCYHPGDFLPGNSYHSGSYNVPACCEHVTLHTSMRLHGHGNIYINPKMTISY